MVLSIGITYYAEIAWLGHVKRTRVTQIMNLVCLASDIQEAILFLPLTEHAEIPSANATSARLPRSSTGGNSESSGP